MLCVNSSVLRYVLSHSMGLLGEILAVLNEVQLTPSNRDTLGTESVIISEVS